jgi:capsular polysaccharide export protein
MENVLLLQGPLGTFFKKLSLSLYSQNITAFKINFNGGDKLFSRAKFTHDFSGRPELWEDYLTDYISAHNIDTIIVYGDCRFYHKVAAKVAKQKNITYWVFEEGYLRAGFVTLEKQGCNANSPLDKSIQAIASSNNDVITSKEQVGNTFFTRLVYACLYYFVAMLQSRKFKHYKHHRPWAWWQEGLFWLNNFKQKFVSSIVDTTALKKFTKKYHNQYFLLPLQVEVDFQMRDHSAFTSVQESIEHVLASFAKYAKSDDALLIKHHPQSRGFSHYGKLIKRISTELQISERVLYVHKAHLPTVYHSCKGVVTVNSTVGLSAVLHHLPTITLGKAIYDIPELTYQGELNDFWTNSFTVNEELFTQFQGYLQKETQLAGDYYKPSNAFLSSITEKLIEDSLQQQKQRQIQLPEPEQEPEQKTKPIQSTVVEVCA